MFERIVDPLRVLLQRHHELYSGQCKAEYWEELCSKALITAGYGSDWKPDFNHTVGVDQSTDTGAKISNKGGSLKNKILTISGSRLTKHKTIEEKVDFISLHHEDYIFCLATDKDEWDSSKPVYNLIIIDSRSLDYKSATWIETYAQRGKQQGKCNGWITSLAKGFVAKIVMSMSHQLWIDIDSELFIEEYRIEL